VTVFAVYHAAMSFAEILDEIPKLSFAERQELVRRAIALDDEFTPEENAILDTRMEDFRLHPDAGIPLEELKDRVRERISRR
jgi:putative addiction module component (TIGR02574 family)